MIREPEDLPVLVKPRWTANVGKKETGCIPESTRGLGFLFFGDPSSARSVLLRGCSVGKTPLHPALGWSDFDSNLLAGVAMAPMGHQIGRRLAQTAAKIPAVPWRRCVARGCAVSG